MFAIWDHFTILDSKIKYLREEEYIGGGVFAKVFKVRHLQSNAWYALKKIYLDKDEKITSDSFNEIKILQRVKHQNIISFVYYEYNQIERILNIVLELASHGDLCHFIKNHIRTLSLIPEQIIWRFSIELSSALDYLHSHSIVHKDLKPANIFLMEDGRIKIGDFGMSEWYFDETRQYSNNFIGTPYYMSPERLLLKEYSFNCDIWSLGCIIYELAALQSPFHVNKCDMNLLIYKVVKCNYPPLPSDIFSVELQNVIAQCLTADCSIRPEAKDILNLISRNYTTLI